MCKNILAPNHSLLYTVQKLIIKKGGRACNSSSCCSDSRISPLLLWKSTVQTAGHRKFMVYFADKKSTIGFCFVSCCCIVVDVDKQIGFHGNARPSCKQRPPTYGCLKVARSSLGGG